MSDMMRLIIIRDIMRSIMPIIAFISILFLSVIAIALLDKYQKKKERERKEAERRWRAEEALREQQRIQLEMERKEQEKQEALAAWEVVRDPSPGMIFLQKKREREEELENPHVWTDLDYDVFLWGTDKDGRDVYYRIGEIGVCESDRINYRYGVFVPTPGKIAKNICKYVSLEEMRPVFQKWRDHVAQIFPLGQEFPRSEIMYDEMEARGNREREERIRQRNTPQQVFINRPKCPLCGSTNIGPIGAVERGLSVGFLGVASPTIGKSYECRSCHYRW